MLLHSHVVCKYFLVCSNACFMVGFKNSVHVSSDKLLLEQVSVLCGMSKHQAKAIMLLGNTLDASYNKCMCNFCFLCW